MFAFITERPLINIVLLALIFTVVAFIGSAFVFKILRKKYEQRKTNINLFIDYLKKPVLFLLTVFSVRLGVTFTPHLNEYSSELIPHITTILVITGSIWLTAKFMDVFSEIIINRFDVSVSDNLRARKVHTQLKVLKRIIFVLLCIIGLAAILMTFEKVRQLGTSLIASAGVIGIILGVAAQKTIHTFITGIQIAITQPIRLDDVVIVENEWGRIEEITLTYVIVRIWDQRRLILPITYFIEKPFQNWTTKTSDLLGSVYIYTDYKIPVNEVREHLKEIVNNNPKWDGKVCVLQVTGSGEKTLELRALVSAADASIAWELRCQIREQLVEFIQTNYPQCLPRVRADLDNTNKSQPSEEHNQ
ncbi:MAG: mechanosensitive ion channel family protein [Sedimentisphaeraceae bacterium JB056]